MWLLDDEDVELELDDVDEDELDELLLPPKSGPVSVVNVPPKVRSYPLPLSSPVSVLVARGQYARKLALLTGVALAASAANSVELSIASHTRTCARWTPP